MEIKNNKLGQSFSADILIVVVVLLFGVLFLVMNKIDTAENKDIAVKYEEATVDSKVIVDNLKSTQVLNNENNVDVEKLLLLDDEQMKNELGIKGDFAIVFEKDGKLVKIDSQNNINCVGSSNLVVNGVSCR